MKKVVLALALFAFVGSSAVMAAPVNNDKDKTEKKEKKNKKNKKNKKGACTTAEMKACGPKDAAAAGGKSCCAKKTASAEAEPVQAQ